MRHLARTALMLALLALGLRAQVTPSPESSPAKKPVSAAPEAPPPAPKRNRAISGDVAAMLASNLPKYTPPPPAPPPLTDAELAKKAEDDAADLRETDKPKNAIVRLEKFVVQEQRPVIFSERQIHTKKGLAALAMRRYISDADRALNRWTLPLFGSSSEARALAMYADDERLKNMADLSDNVNMVMKSDPTTGGAAKDAAQKTFMRSTQFGYGGMAPK